MHVELDLPFAIFTGYEEVRREFLRRIYWDLVKNHDGSYDHGNHSGTYSPAKKLGGGGGSLMEDDLDFTRNGWDDTYDWTENKI